MYNPRVTSAGSIMPRFPWLITNELDRSEMVNKMKLMKNAFDVPYTKAQIDSANAWADNQASVIVQKIYSEAADIKEQVAQEKLPKATNLFRLRREKL